MSPRLAAVAGPRPVREEAIHRALVDLLRRSAVAGVAWTHIPAGEARAAGIGGKLKGMGTAPGWPDLIFIYRGEFFGLELKRSSGRVSPAQRAAQDEITRAGGHVAVAYGLDEAIGQLAAWGLIRVSPGALSSRAMPAGP